MVWLGFCLAIMSGLVIGQQQRPPAWLTLLNFDYCELPCWIGITPGKTTVQEAQQQIEQVYRTDPAYQVELHPNYEFKVSYTPTRDTLAIHLRGERVELTAAAVVQGIFLVPLLTDDSGSERPVLGDMYGAFGEASTITLTANTLDFQILLHFARQQMQIFLPAPLCNKIPVSQEINALLVGQVRPMIVPWLSEPQAWRGFERCNRFTRRGRS
jgi:hypothetical protein